MSLNLTTINISGLNNNDDYGSSYSQYIYDSIGQTFSKIINSISHNNNTNEISKDNSLIEEEIQTNRNDYSDTSTYNFTRGSQTDYNNNVNGVTLSNSHTGKTIFGILHQDPIATGYSFNIIVNSSPLFNGSINNFLNDYGSNNDEINTRNVVYGEFLIHMKNMFMFENDAHNVYNEFDSDQNHHFPDINKTVGGEPGTSDVDQSNKYDDRYNGSLGLDNRVPNNLSKRPFYLKKISGLDKLTEVGTSNNSPDSLKSFNDYGKDVIKLSLLEDTSLSLSRLLMSYRTLCWSKLNGKQLIPENLLRFDLEIEVFDIRNYRRVIHNFEAPDKKHKISYLLYECQLLTNGMPHGDSLDMSNLPNLDNNGELSFNYKFSTTSLSGYRSYLNNNIISFDEFIIDNAYKDPYKRNKGNKNIGYSFFKTHQNNSNYGINLINGKNGYNNSFNIKYNNTITDTTQYPNINFNTDKSIKDSIAEKVKNDFENKSKKNIQRLINEPGKQPRILNNNEISNVYISSDIGTLIRSEYKIPNNDILSNDSIFYNSGKYVLLTTKKINTEAFLRTRKYTQIIPMNIDKINVNILYDETNNNQTDNVYNTVIDGYGNKVIGNTSYFQKPGGKWFNPDSINNGNNIILTDNNMINQSQVNTENGKRILPMINTPHNDPTIDSNVGDTITANVYSSSDINSLIKIRKITTGTTEYNSTENFFQSSIASFNKGDGKIVTTITNQMYNNYNNQLGDIGNVYQYDTWTIIKNVADRLFFSFFPPNVYNENLFDDVHNTISLVKGVRNLF